MCFLPASLRMSGFSMRDMGLMVIRTASDGRVGVMSPVRPGVRLISSGRGASESRNGELDGVEWELDIGSVSRIEGGIRTEDERG